jgi:hypothetical protein
MGAPNGSKCLLGLGLCLGYGYAFDVGSEEDVDADIDSFLGATKILPFLLSRSKGSMNNKSFKLSHYRWPDQYQIGITP